MKLHTSLSFGLIILISFGSINAGRHSGLIDTKNDARLGQDPEITSIGSHSAVVTDESGRGTFVGGVVGSNPHINKHIYGVQHGNIGAGVGTSSFAGSGVSGDTDYVGVTGGYGGSRGGYGGSHGVFIGSKGGYGGDPGVYSGAHSGSSGSIGGYGAAHGVYSGSSGSYGGYGGSKGGYGGSKGGYGGPHGVFIGSTGGDDSFAGFVGSGGTNIVTGTSLESSSLDGYDVPHTEHVDSENTSGHKSTASYLEGSVPCGKIVLCPAPSKHYTPGKKGTHISTSVLGSGLGSGGIVVGAGGVKNPALNTGINLNKEIGISDIPQYDNSPVDYDFYDDGTDGAGQLNERVGDYLGYVGDDISSSGVGSFAGVSSGAYAGSGFYPGNYHVGYGTFGNRDTNNGAGVGVGGFAVSGFNGAGYGNRKYGAGAFNKKHGGHNNGNHGKVNYVIGTSLEPTDDVTIHKISGSGVDGVVVTGGKHGNGHFTAIGTGSKGINTAAITGVSTGNYGGSLVSTGNYDDGGISGIGVSTGNYGDGGISGIGVSTGSYAGGLASAGSLASAGISPGNYAGSVSSARVYGR